MSGNGRERRKLVDYLGLDWARSGYLGREVQVPQRLLKKRGWIGERELLRLNLRLCPPPLLPRMMEEKGV